MWISAYTHRRTNTLGHPTEAAVTESTEHAGLVFGGAAVTTSELDLTSHMPTSGPYDVCAAYADMIAPHDVSEKRQWALCRHRLCATLVDDQTQGRLIAPRA